MRVKISANPPLPPVRAWFPLSAQGHPSISSFKSLLCASLPAFRGVAPASLRLSIDGFELLDNSELTVVRDGDLICIDILDADATARGTPHATWPRLESAPSHKRKRHMSTPSSSSSESDSTTSPSASDSESGSETSDSESASDSDVSPRPTASFLRQAEPPNIHARERAQVTPSVQPKPHVADPATFVPPGYGKPQTRSRNLRRRLKRTHEREGGPVSGANAVVPGEVPAITPDVSRDIPALLSLSLRNKNKAKNFKSLIGRPLAPKIIFGDQEGDASAGGMATPECLVPTQAPPRLIPPSSRSSLPPNLFVTSIDVEAGLHRDKKKRKMRVEYGDELEEETEVVSLDYGEPEPEVDIEKLESIADKDWATLEKPTNEKQVVRGMLVGYKALGINPVTYTPEQCLTVGRVVSCDNTSVVVRPLRGREEVSFSGPVGPEEAVEEGHTWEDIQHGDWRIFPF